MGVEAAVKAASAFFFGGGGGATDLGLLLVRVFFGLAMAFGHGLGKLPPSERFVSGVLEMGFPAPLFFAWAAGLAEFAGGLLLAAGLLTRPSALFIAVTMAVAGFVRHAPDPFKAKELAFAYLFLALLFLLAGSGRFGLDALLRRRFSGGSAG